MRNLLPLASALLAAVALSLIVGPAAEAAQGRRDAISQSMHREQTRSALAQPIATSQASLSKLEKDKRRKKYRDGWDAIAAGLAAAVRHAPSDLRADEARLLIARVREEQWGVSRSAGDAQVAVLANVALDAIHPGSEAGRTGLLAAVRLAHRAHLSKELAQAAKRLAKYPRSTEVNEALALAPAIAPRETKRAASGEGLSARAASASDRKASVPVESDDDDSADDESADTSRGGAAEKSGARAAVKSDAGASEKSIAVAAKGGAGGPAADGLRSGSASDARAGDRPAAHFGKSSLRAERAGRDAPPSPEQEPDTDVPASAAHVFDQLVQAARAQGAGDLVGDTAPRGGSADPKSDAADAPSAAADSKGGATDLKSGAEKNGAADSKSGAADSKSATDRLPSDPQPEVQAAREDAKGDSDDEDLPEPEDSDEPAAVTPHHTLASAPRALVAPGDAESEAKARALRKSVLSGNAGSMAAQLGLKVHRVVVDAGHGGKDTGAIGPHGLREKDVTLSIAKKLVAKLRAAGLEVVMTRDSDEFVSLNERTRIANDANADLFISVHCNAARRRKLTGVETWTLNVSADRYAQRLAAFENAETEETVSNLRMILADLATKANASDARELAETVQSSMVKTLRTKVGKVKDNGVKQALFYVLLGTHMPSILVETAFLSNPDEEKRLKSAKYQDGAAEAIARGVKQYIDSRRELARAL